MIRRAQQIGKTYRSYTSDKGCYVSVVPDVEAQQKLVEWSNILGHWLSPVQESELHCTVINSPDGSPEDFSTDASKPFLARVRGFEYWDGHDNEGYLVVTLSSDDLVQRHHYWLAAGADHTFAVYAPHVTLVTGLRSTYALYQRMIRLGDRVRGTVLRFYNEQVENNKH